MPDSNIVARPQVSSAADHVSKLMQLALDLSGQAAPQEHDRLDVQASAAAQVVAQAVTNRVNAILNQYTDTAPTPEGSDARVERPGASDVTSLAHALLKRAAWLNHAWLMNRYDMPNAWSEAPPVDPCT